MLFAMVREGRRVVLARVVEEIRATEPDRRADPLGAALRVAAALEGTDLMDYGITLRDIAGAGAGLSKSTLNNYLAAGRQVAYLGDGLGLSLSLSQHIALSGAPGWDVRERLAQECVAAGWSAAELKRRVAEARRDGPGPFVRPRLRVFARKAAAEVDSLLSDNERVRNSLTKYPEEARQEVAAHLRRLIRRLRPVVAGLEAADERRAQVLERAERARRGSPPDAE